MQDHALHERVATLETKVDSLHERWLRDFEAMGEHWDSRWNVVTWIFGGMSVVIVFLVGLAVSALTSVSSQIGTVDGQQQVNLAKVDRMQRDIDDISSDMKQMLRGHDFRKMLDGDDAQRRPER